MTVSEAKRLKELEEENQRRLCKLIGLTLSIWHYKSQPDDDEEVRQRLRELAGERRRWGYRQVHEVLRREGIVINHKRTERLYREEGLQLKTRKRKKSVATLRIPLPNPETINQRWTMDFLE